MARRSLRLPSSWATEINLQSRYPGGILIPKIGVASPSVCPDAGATWAAAPASATTRTITNTIRLILCLLFLLLVRARNADSLYVHNPLQLPSTMLIAKGGPSVDP